MTPIRSTTQRTGIEGAVMGGETLQSLAISLSEARAENERLRAALAQSDLPCAYCSLPKDEWAKCASGFPGCDRADDAMGCPELGARLSIESATRQRDEALTALKASEEREAALLAALRPFALAARDCDVEDDIRIGVVKPDQDIWESPVAMSITFAHVANALQLRENCKAPLADATNNPPSDPGTEQREAGV